MTPAEQLTAARLNVVGPYLPAKEEWLKGWTGPAQVRRYHPDEPEGIWDDVAWMEDIADSGLVVTSDPSRIRLDTRRPEVRHLLVDLGIAPEWARKSAVACWCAGMGVVPVAALYEWGPWSRARMARHRLGTPLTQRAVSCERWQDAGWSFNLSWEVAPDIAVKDGPETGDLGRACADIAALRARCILTAPGGYYVPLADGGIGWWAEVNHAR